MGSLPLSEDHLLTRDNLSIAEEMLRYVWSCLYADGLLCDSRDSGESGIQSGLSTIRRDSVSVFVEEIFTWISPGANKK